MIEFLITVLILCIVIYVIYLVLGMIQLPAPIKTIVYLIVGLILLIAVLNYTGIYHLSLNQPVLVRS